MLSIDTSSYTRRWATHAEVQDYDPENRDDETRDEDKQVGDLAELAFAELLSAYGVKHKWDGKDEKYDPYDFLIYSEREEEWLTVDVKCRKKWLGYTDLIVQSGKHGNHSADINIRAMMVENGRRVEFAGYATAEETLAAQRFWGANGEDSKQIKRIVYENQLHEIDELFPEFQP